jgi:predicted dehydrogenase
MIHWLVDKRFPSELGAKVGSRIARLRASLALVPGNYDWVGGASCVLECLLTGKPSLITPEHGLHVLEVMNACHESQRTGRRVKVESTFKWQLLG